MKSEIMNCKNYEINELLSLARKYSVEDLFLFSIPLRVWKTWKKDLEMKNAKNVCW